jgi:hypothetical protein
VPEVGEHHAHPWKSEVHAVHILPSRWHFTVDNTGSNQQWDTKAKKVSGNDCQYLCKQAVHTHRQTTQHTGR